MTLTRQKRAGYSILLPDIVEDAHQSTTSSWLSSKSYTLEMASQSTSGVFRKVLSYNRLWLLLSDSKGQVAEL